MSGFDPFFRSLKVVGSWSPQSAATFSAVSASATLSTELTAALHVERNSHTNSITQYISNGKNSSSFVVCSHETTSQLHTFTHCLIFYTSMPRWYLALFWLLLELKGHLVLDWVFLNCEYIYTVLWRSFGNISWHRAVWVYGLGLLY